MECVRVVAFQELISAHNESTSRTQYRCAIEMRIPLCINRSETDHIEINVSDMISIDLSFIVPQVVDILTHSSQVV
jgi:hypothetical protein